MDAATISAQKTLDRFNAAQDRLARDMGHGDTIGALGITRFSLDPLTAFIETKLNVPKGFGRPLDEHRVLNAIRKLPTATTALAVLNGALHSIALCEPFTETCMGVGTVVHGELWAAGLFAADSELAGKIERVVKRRHGSFKYRKQAARSIAARAGYTGERWGKRELLKAGRLLLEYLVEALPDTFVKDADNADPVNTREFLTITPGALALAEQAVERALRGSPVFVPSTEPPKPWSGWYDGGYWDAKSRFRHSIVRTRYKETAGAIRAAINDGTMAPFLGALNALQAVPWKVNQRVLGVVKWAYENSIAVEGLPPLEDLPMPTKSAAWDGMTPEARKLWKTQAAKVKQRNRTFTSQRVMMKLDLEAADMMVEADRFWTPMNTDWRGRVYSVTSFNFQRDDRVRSLFLFADGEPIGEEGLKWLKVHVANCGDFDKVSKRSIEERVKWTEENLERIEQMTCVPTKELWWTKADKPFLFLAACIELTSVIAAGVSFVTRLPISFDGSCSGLQHLSAMTRDEQTAELVNLLPSTHPRDVYQTIAELVNVRVAADAQTGGRPSAVIPNMWLRYGITRKLVKRNVMTYSYSSKKFGMAKQLMDDLMRPLEFEVLTGAYDVHPFGEDNGKEAAKYLAGITFAAIEQTVYRPAQAMTMLQKTARALAHEGKPLVWTTPLGLPWINRYHEWNMKTVDLTFHDIRITMNYADGHKPDIDKSRSANGVAPNFVHACDATHLLMVAAACASENLTQVATVHDSFGCLAPRAGRFREIIREQFVKLYQEHDVLAEVLAQAKHDLTVHNEQRLPARPDDGALNLEEVLHADYAFA